MKKDIKSHVFKHIECTKKHSKINRLNSFQGFTLAETILTVLIVGIISMLVLPAFKGDIDQRVISNQQKVAKQKLNYGFHRMQIKGELGKRYYSTEDFVTAMEKYFNIVKVCPSDELYGCFGDKIRSSKTEVAYELKNIRTSNQLGIDFPTPSNVVGIVFNDGIKALIAYNTDCVMTNQWDTAADVTECFAMYYDVTGENNPGIIGKDIIPVNTGWNN